MADPPQFSKKVLDHPTAANAEARERITIAKRRIQSILDREVVAHQKTLEQKISEQGPRPQRADPHLVGLALVDLLELNRLRAYAHPETGERPCWFANPATPEPTVRARLLDLAPLYGRVSGHGFGNLTGDALELIVYKSLEHIYARNRRYAYLGSYHLDRPKKDGRYQKTPPPKTLGSYSTTKEADFIQFGHDAGPLCIECKNYREWTYPHHDIIKQLVIKSAQLGAIPVLIARRLHYSTRTNLLEPAGIIAHETYLQYYPADQAELAEKAKHKRSLGFTDVTAIEEPHPRTLRFFAEIVPSIVDRMAARWTANREALVYYSHGHINLAQLYTAINSPAGGKWREFESEEGEGYDPDEYE